MAHIVRTGIPFALGTLLAAAAHGQASVNARVETVAIPSSGDAADDAAIWIHPTHPGLSVVIGTDKSAGLIVYDLAGNQLQFLAHGRMNNVDLRYRFPLRGKLVTLVTSGERDQDRLAAYVLAPNTRRLFDVAARDIALGFDVYGCCMYRSPVTGDYYFFGTSEDGEVEQWRLFDTPAGRVDAVLVRSFDLGSTTEGCVADDENAYLFVAEEEVGIWRYGAEPGDGSARVLIDSTGSGGQLDADVEGLALYYAPGGGGHLIASSQGNSTFVVYQRSPPHAYLHTFEVGANGSLGIDAVSGTDGIEVTNRALGSGFPSGMLVVQDDSNPGANQNFKLIGWEEIAATSPALALDSGYDPHGTSCPSAAWSYRNGSGQNPSTLVNLTPPVLGSSWQSSLDCSAHSPGPAFLFAFTLPAAGTFVAPGELLVDPASHFLFSVSRFSAAIPAHFSLNVPADLLLCGARASVQGACLGAPGPRLTNAIDLVLGL